MGIWFEGILRWRNQYFSNHFKTILLRQGRYVGRRSFCQIQRQIQRSLQGLQVLHGIRSKTLKIPYFRLIDHFLFQQVHWGGQICDITLPGKKMGNESYWSLQTPLWKIRPQVHNWNLQQIQPNWCQVQSLEIN